MIAVGGRDRRAGNGLQRGGGDEKRQHQAAITSSTARSISAISGSRDRRCSPSFIIHVCTSAERSLLARRSAISNGTSLSAWPWLRRPRPPTALPPSLRPFPPPHPPPPPPH